MSIIKRRSFLTGLIAAPFVIRNAGILMPVKKIYENPCALISLYDTFYIEKMYVNAVSRSLKANYTLDILPDIVSVNSAIRLPENKQNVVYNGHEAWDEFI